MKATAVFRLMSAIGFILCGLLESQADPLPKFTYRGVALNPEELKWCPTQEIEHPAFIKVEGLVENPLGKYYLYYGPHKHEGVGLAYSDSIEGPWTEYEGNPVVREGAPDGPLGCAAPDVRWVVDERGVGKFFLWAHSNNSYTELWTSADGIDFEYQGKSIEAAKIGTKNATYTRMYEYPIKNYGNKYIMLYVGWYRPDSGSPDAGKRCVFLAHSSDAESWTQLKTPIVKPGEGETEMLYDPAFFRWKGKNYIVYADNNVWRGGTLKYVEIDRDLDPVGADGKRYTLMDEPEGPKELEGRLRSPEFLIEGDTIHMISGGGKSPRVCVYSTASAGG